MITRLQFCQKYPHIRQKLPDNFAAYAYFVILLSTVYTYHKLTEPEVHA